MRRSCSTWNCWTCDSFNGSGLGARDLTQNSGPEPQAPSLLVESIEVVIESLTPSGDGVARAGRLRMLVPFTIPGERARVQIARRRGTEVDAVLDEIVTPSPHRVAAPCPHFGPCGGCTWQHIAYPHQLILKRDLVA